MFDFQGQSIDVSEQAIFTLKYSGFRYEEGNKIDISNLLIATQSQLVFLSFMMTVHPYLFDPKSKHSRMDFRACVQLTLDVYGIYAITYTQMLKTSRHMLFHLADIDYGRNPDIVTLNK